MKDKIIGLVDGNNFFVSCEILMNPALRGKPVCVLSNNDGCVIARSYEAKKLGIKMGMPYFIAKRDFPSVIYLSSNFALYHDISVRMMELLKNYTDKLDIYSIDEAFLDLTGCDDIFGLSFLELAKKIKSDIENNIGLSVSVGIAPSKVLAKVAAQKAKDNRTFYYVIDRHLIRNEIENVPVDEIWGIGKNIAHNLRGHGIFYADEILLKNDNFFKDNYGKKELELKYELAGYSVIPLTGIIEKPKSIQRTKAFPVFSKNKQYITNELSIHLHNVCKKLRENNLETIFIGVLLRTKDFHIFGSELKLEFYTNNELRLVKYVKILLDKIFKENVIYRASGIYAGMLKDMDERQLNLFSNLEENKYKNISKVIDKIENKYGKYSIAAGEIGIKNYAD